LFGYESAKVIKIMKRITFYEENAG
jgi:hypothetical protein